MEKARSYKMDIQRRKLFTMAILASSALCLPCGALAAEAPDQNAPSGDASAGQAAGKPANSDAIINSIKTRRSVRSYTSQPVSDADLTTILECGMLAPSAANEQPWEFVVIRDKAILNKIGQEFQYAAYAGSAPVAILACLDENKEKVKGMGVLDVAIACENMLLAAHALGLGGVFTGVYPEKDRMDNYRQLLGLPANVVPISLLIFGYPKTQQNHVPNRYNPSAVHQDKW